MTRQEELQALLADAFQREVARMGIDVQSGARTLERELATSERRARRRRLGALAAAVVAGVALLGWYALRNDQQAMPALTPPGGTLSQSQGQTPSERADEPYLLDLRTGIRTPFPKWLAPGKDSWPVFSARPGTRELALATCPLRTYGCAGPGSITLSSLDRWTVATIPVPEGLVPMGVEVSPDGGRLLYPATDGSSYSVPEFYLYDLSTKRTRRLTDIPLESAWWWSLRSAFSSDGRTILYDLPRVGQEVTRWDVWSVPVGGGPATRLVPDAMGPRAIPGTTDLAVLTPKQFGWEGSAIEIVTASGTRRTLVESRSGIGTIQASPDGRRLAYSDVETGAWVVDLVTGQKTHVADQWAGAWVDAETLVILP
jgi:hypothetical protein